MTGVLLTNGLKSSGAKDLDINNVGTDEPRHPVGMLKGTRYGIRSGGVEHALQAGGLLQPVHTLLWLTLLISVWWKCPG